jgi:DNA-binding transcriptional MerR regulator
MYSIGEFSRINRITPKTLRHYDRIGLLRPAKIDEWTGYRYYAAEQLPQIGRILMLKGFGCSLSEIREILADDSKLESLLRERERAIKRTIRDERGRLDRVSSYLAHITQGETMNTVITLKPLPEVVVASMRTTVPNYDAFFTIVPKMGEYMNSVGAVCRTPAYCFTMFHNDEYREEDIDVEICEAVVEPREASELVQFRTVSGVATAACIDHRGPYATIGASYNALFAWIADIGYTPVDHPRESYVDGIWNREDPSDWLTEVQVPVERKGHT